jgi:hypothetical protein
MSMIPSGVPEETRRDARALWEVKKPMEQSVRSLILTSKGARAPQ